MKKAYNFMRKKYLWMAAGQSGANGRALLNAAHPRS